MARFTTGVSRESDSIENRRKAYLCVQGRLAPGVTPAACSRWNRPPRGGFGRAPSFAVFNRKAFCAGVSATGPSVEGVEVWSG